MYVFDENDPIIRAWQAMFPALFRPASEMPAESAGACPLLRRLLFRAQTEIYRTFHMQDPEAFYNKEDLWDIAKNVYSQAQQGESRCADVRRGDAARANRKPEFLLLQSFTPRSKDNLIGVMAARCDPDALRRDRRAAALEAEPDLRPAADRGAHRFGPEHRERSGALEPAGLAGAARADAGAADRQHVPVCRADLHPVIAGTMPQLKKVVLAMGNRLIYRDTYEEALAELAGAAPIRAGCAFCRRASQQPTSSAATPACSAAGQHRRRYGSTFAGIVNFRLRDAGPKRARNSKRSRSWSAR